MTSSVSREVQSLYGFCGKQCGSHAELEEIHNSDAVMKRRYVATWSGKMTSCLVHLEPHFRTLGQCQALSDKEKFLALSRIRPIHCTSWKG